MRFLFLAIALFPFMVFADVVAKAENVVGAIPDGSAPYIGAVAVVLELLMRFKKTQKPLSLLHSLAKLLKVVAHGALKFADFLDKALPQRSVEKISE